MTDDGWPYAGMQNADIGLAPLVICLVCLVIDGTKPKMRDFRPTGPGFSGLGQVLDQTFRYASFQVFAHTCTLPVKLPSDKSLRVCAKTWPSTNGVHKVILNSPVREFAKW